MQAVEQFEKLVPDLLLVDLNLPDISGFEVIRRVRQVSATPLIIVLTGQNEKHLLKQVSELKVNAILKKSDSGKNLTDALAFIQRHGHNKMFFDPTVEAILETEENYIPSKREAEVLELIIKGMTSEKIALALDCSVATVKTYRARIMNKSGTRNSAEMISWFLQRNGKDNFGSRS